MEHERNPQLSATVSPSISNQLRIIWPSDIRNYPQPPFGESVRCDFSPEDVSPEAIDGFQIEDPERTFFVMMAWENDQAVADFVRKYHAGPVNLLPGQEVYVCGHFSGNG